MVDRKQKRALLDRFDAAVSLVRSRWSNAANDFEDAVTQLNEVIDRLRTNDLRIDESDLEKRRLQSMAELEEAKMRVAERRKG